MCLQRVLKTRLTETWLQQMLFAYPAERIDSWR
jgi:hypothetical protein